MAPMQRDYVNQLKDERDALADALGRKHAEVERLREALVAIETDADDDHHLRNFCKAVLDG